MVDNLNQLLRGQPQNERKQQEIKRKNVARGDVTRQRFENLCTNTRREQPQQQRREQDENTPGTATVARRNRKTVRRSTQKREGRRRNAGDSVIARAKNPDAARGKNEFYIRTRFALPNRRQPYVLRNLSYWQSAGALTSKKPVSIQNK